MIKAAESLGGQTALARVLALFIDGLCYSDAYLTDGYIPRGVVAKTKVTPKPLTVARALTGAHLWHRVNGGFRIHDYDDYNKSADEVKDIQRKWREKKRRQRRNHQGEFSQDRPAKNKRKPGQNKSDPLQPRLGDISLVSTDSLTKSGKPVVSPDLSPGESHRTRARGTGTGTGTGTTVLVPTSHEREIRVRRTAGVLTARFARGTHPTTTTTTTKKAPTHRILCAMLSAELADDDSIGNALEGVKLRLVRQGFAYPEGDRLDRAVQAIDRARRRKAIA